MCYTRQHMPWYMQSDCALKREPVQSMSHFDTGILPIQRNWVSFLALLHLWATSGNLREKTWQILQAHKPVMQRKWIPRPATDKASDQCSSNIPPPGPTEEIASIFRWFQKWFTVQSVCCVCCTNWIDTIEQLLSVWDERIPASLGWFASIWENMCLEFCIFWLQGILESSFSPYTQSFVQGEE